MAKGNGKAQANGHETANENFANGYCDDGAPNENAAKGLANALEHNPFECSTTIDFDSGVTAITGEYSSYWEASIYGTYSEDGYTFDFSSYDWSYYDYGYEDIGSPVFDADGDGDSEFGVNIYDTTGNDYYSWTYTYAAMTNDDGNNFSLESFNVQQEDGYYYYDYFQFYTSEFDAVENTYESAYAYTYDDVTWYTYDYEYDYDTHTYTQEYGSTTDEAEVAALFDDVSTLYISMSGEFSVDDIVVHDMAA